jgi:PhzF family phenazine biosynthesis protein
MRFFIVDAFTEKIFGGNAAGVVIIPENADFPPDRIMCEAAAELRYSETAFVKQTGVTTFRTRYFTPVAEVDLCGHATIASFHALAEQGLVPRDGKCTNRTLAGDLDIEINDGTVWMDMAAPEYMSRIDDEGALDELYSIMGLEQDKNRPLLSSAAAEGGFYPEIISTGLPDIILPVASQDRLNAIAPDYQALAELSRRYDVTGVHAFCVSDERGTADDGASIYHCRNFAPLYGIDEEAATGTANGALTYYLYRRGAVTPGSPNIFIQGEAMSRPSRVMTVLEVDQQDADESKVKVGGRAATLATGEILI